MNERLLTVAEACRRVPILTEPQLRGLISRKEIEAVKIGHRWLIPESEMQKRFGVLYRAS
jgi:excisionase family DNA binding protein